MNAVTNYCMKMLAAKKHKPLYADPNPRYDAPLHFWALEDGSTIELQKQGSPTNRTFLYSLDGANWETWDRSAITLNRGDIVYIKNSTNANSSASSAAYWHFQGTGKICVGGQLKSLYFNDSSYWLNKAYADACQFSRLFYQMHSLYSAETLKININEVKTNDKFAYMFYECINLKRAPDITAKFCTASSMCASMFRMCVSLDKAPTIYTRTIGNSGFDSMFIHSGIRRAPALLPSNIPYRGCYYTFWDCMALETLPKMRVRSINSTGTIGGEFYDMFGYCINLQGDKNPIDIDIDRCNSDTFAYMFLASSVRKAPKIKVVQTAEETARNTSFANMFYQCNFLEDASNIDITSNEVWNGTFNNMFYLCSSLKYAPKITAKIVKGDLTHQTSFTGMFQGCFSLEDASCISITGESTNQLRFSSMFADCSKLRKAPTINVKVTETQSLNFNSMFSGCRSIEDLSTITIKGGLFVQMFDTAFSGCFNLLKAPNIDIDGDVQTKCYNAMFTNCRKMTAFPALPYKGTMQESCFQSMFSGCRAMTQPPANYNVTGCAKNACYSMFQDCINLRSAPIGFFSATANTFEGCYRSAFYNCLSLVEAPEITLKTNTGTNGLNSTFYNCVSLRYIKTHLKAWTGCSNWTYGLRTALSDIYQPFTNGGGGKRVFVCPSDATMTRGTSAIPTNWDIETFEEQ